MRGDWRLPSLHQSAIDTVDHNRQLQDLSTRPAHRIHHTRKPTCSETHQVIPFAGAETRDKFEDWRAESVSH